MRRASQARGEVGMHESARKNELCWLTWLVVEEEGSDEGEELGPAEPDPSDHEPISLPPTEGPEALPHRLLRSRLRRRKGLPGSRHLVAHVDHKGVGCTARPQSCSRPLPKHRKTFRSSAGLADDPWTRGYPEFLKACSESEEGIGSKERGFKTWRERLPLSFFPLPSPSHSTKSASILTGRSR